MELHAVFQHQHLAPVRSRLGGLVGLPEHPLGLGILEVARELDPAARGFGIVVEEPCAIVLRGQCHAKALTGKLDGTQAQQAVRGQTPQVPDLATRQDQLVTRLVLDPVAVVTFSEQLHAHPIRMNWDQLGDLASAVGQDLTESIAAQGQVPLQHLAPLERVLVPVGLLAQQPVEPVVRHPVLAAVCSSAVDHQWERGHGLRQYAHAGIDRCQAHGRIG